MKQLSKKILAIALMLGSLSFYSCKKGDTGDPGVNGNANVTQINFGSKTIPASVNLNLTLTGITKSIADKSLILTYGQQGGLPYWYPMTGYYLNWVLSKTFWSRIESKDPESILIISTLTGPATSETYDAIRVLVIPANVFVNGRSANPPFDINDYQSVRQYFNLPK